MARTHKRALIFRNRWGGWTYCGLELGSDVRGRERWLWLARIAVIVRLGVFNPEIQK